jgi:hypothetical protein
MINPTCLQCSNDDDGDIVFDSVKELNDHIRNGHQPRPKKPQQNPRPAPAKAVVAPSVAPQPVKKPITLFYKFEGTCEDCFGSLDTIEVELEKNRRVAVVAYCPKCKKQYIKKEVVPIDNQFQKVKN